MPRSKSVGITAALLYLLLAASVSAQETGVAEPGRLGEQRKPPVVKEEPDIATLEKMSQDAYDAGKYVRYYGANIRMMNQRPYEPLYMQRVIAACALLERKNTAYHYMLRMQQQGLSYALSEDPDTENIRNTELYAYLNDLMVEAGQPAGVADPVASLTGENTDAATLTWDPSRELFLVGTKSNGKIISLAPDGSQEVLIQANDENGLWAIKGLHADGPNNRLWISSSATPEFSAFQPSDQGRAALFEFNLKTLELVNRFNVPVDGLPHELGPMAVSGAGDVYLVDHTSAVVYRKAANGKALEHFVGSKEMNALVDIAISPDNKRLYIADRYKGILVVDPQEQSSAMLTGPETLNLGRISGLSYGEKKLFMVQSDMQPERLMQLDLDESGGSVAEAFPLASAMENFDRPGSGIYKNGYVYYFANLGATEQSPAQEPVIVVRTALSTPANRPEMKIPSLQPQDSN